jgi:predicted phage tail protein
MNTRVPLSLVIALLSLSVVAAVAPGPPQNLEASVNGTTVVFTWQPPTIGGAPTEYILDASLSPGGPELVSYAVPSTTATVLDVPNGVYYVRVHALNGDGEGPASNEVVVAVSGGGGGGCTAAPNAPQSLVADVSNSSVALSWSAPSGGCGVTAYSVQAGTSPGASEVAVVNVGTATAFSASAPSGVYYVRVIAVNGFGGSEPSNEVTVTVGCPTPPNPATSLTGASVGNMVRLDWTAAGTGCPATNYAVHAGSAPGLRDLAILDVGAATTLSVSAPPGTYYVRVVAANEVGGSAPSNEIVLSVTASDGSVTGFGGSPAGSPVERQ